MTLQVGDPHFRVLVTVFIYYSPREGPSQDKDRNDNGCVTATFYFCVDKNKGKQ